MKNLWQLMSSHFSESNLFLSCPNVIVIDVHNYILNEEKLGTTNKFLRFSLTADLVLVGPELCIPGPFRLLWTNAFCI